MITNDIRWVESLTGSSKKNFIRELGNLLEGIKEDNKKRSEEPD